MEIQFVIGSEIKFSKKLNMSREELLNTNITKQKFKIPIQKNNYSSNFINKKRKNDFDDFNDDFSSESSLSSSDSFDEISEQELEEDEEIILSQNEDLDNKKHLRKYKSEIVMHQIENYLNPYSNHNNKPKRELTDDEILKKNDQILKRKIHVKKMLEEEKRQTIEKILNEDGRKLRERQKKLSEEAIKKEQQADVNYKMSLTKIKLKHSKDGKIYLRFPQGLLLPKVLMQKNTKNNLIHQKCQVLSCENDKKYRDPVTKLNYCSVACYKVIKNSMHVN